MLQVEHTAFQVQDPAAVANWYTQNLGFRILRKMETSPFIHFLADAAGRVVLEVYNNPAAPVPDYPKLNPLHLHLAFSTDQLEPTRDTLIKAGATLYEDTITTPAGDKLMMLRDPWGFPIQLCKRVKPMLG
jgi:catechol 2,3-dioxygenase-like lactoylglutathione lyase family enzyme